jgi:ppGpp synthetase/RelA/SpoT-type nucleotidyltranferase
VIDDDADRSKTPQFFELQVKTLFQHAWSEAEHDLAYKPSEPITPHQQRQIAFTAAQAWEPMRSSSSFSGAGSAARA